jgi:hypothetical protein
MVVLKRVPALWTLDRVAQFLAVGQQWLLDHIDEIPHVTLPGNRVRFDHEAIVDWARSRRVEP